MLLSGKKVLLGITGSISAYKAADLCRLLIQAEASVRVIMTEASTSFISPLTLSVLSKNKVEVEFVNDDSTWNNHVELGLWADLLVVAPASATTMAKFVNGICDNLLSATYLSARCPVLIAPAMDHDMYLHQATAENISVLKGRNHIIVGPEDGELASGLIGKGRLTDPQKIVDRIINFFNPNQRFKNINVLITAGPTQEAIDPVRYISNHSSGKMGVAIAEAFLKEGANVTLICGPIQLKTHNFIHRIDIVSAEEMYNACEVHFPKAEITIMAAAVADYTSDTISLEKLKKKDDDLVIKLKKTKDILAHLGANKKTSQILVGFALETNNELEHAKDKLKRKNLDLIVLNSLRNSGAGFAGDTNQITIIDKHNNVEDFPLKSKAEVATDIIERIIELKNA
jgi:phosphopantothenoylcysteine decarboxylase/phosphopantothenate--cysteine ligase